MASSHLKLEVPVAKGGIVFRQGDQGDEMFVIERGKIRLTLAAEGHEKEVAVLGAGQFFGELSLIGNAPRSATAQAVEDSVLLAIGRDVFNMMVQDDLSIVYRMMSIQGQRLSRTNQPIEQLAQRLGEVRIAAHILRDLNQRDQFPATVEINDVTQALRLPRDTVEASLSEFAQRNLGKLDAGRFTVHDSAQRDRLLDAICDYATV
jgi:CRP-like cAMP-binding protein